ncbi:MAG: hypothetical protein AAGD10_01425 [Myxococcota bacterium]
MLRLLLELLVQLIGSRVDPKAEDLDEGKLEKLMARLVRGRLKPAEALLVLQAQILRGDERAVAAVLDQLTAVGRVDLNIARSAAAFFLDQRHYREAQRWAQIVAYDFDDFEARRLLAIIDVLCGDYEIGLSHAAEYLTQTKTDVELDGFRMEALLRSGATTDLLEFSERRGFDGPTIQFLRHRPRFGAFSWQGAPTRKGALVGDHDVERFRNFMRGVLRSPELVLCRDLAEVDQRLSAGHYVDDISRLQHPDVWEPPESFQVHMRGDCEDFALWAWTQLVRMGHRARFVLGGLFANQLNHAWVSIHGGDRIQVLECTPRPYNNAITARAALEYRPMFSVDHRLYVYRH